MCHLCQPLAISRRRFLRQTLATGAGILLTACGGQSRVPAVTRGTFRSEISQPAGFPTFAGRVAALDGETLTLEAPVGRRTLPLADSRRPRLLPGDAVVVWVEDGRASAIRHLPPLAATESIPEDLEQPPPTGATRDFGPLKMITRAGWGAARAPQWVAGGEAAPFDAATNPAGWLVYPPPLASWLTTLVVHHSALEFHTGPQPIQRLHMRFSGFADVGYHFLIDGLGQLYEGRLLDIRGAHTGGFNTGTIGVCLLGNFEVAPPIAAQSATLRQLASHLRDAYGVRFLASHRDFQPDDTVCPGSHLWPHLETLAGELGLTWGTDGYRPPSW